jgi:capsular exopolysaccharide synthesis family protein
MNVPRKTSPGRGASEKEIAPFSLDYDHLARLCLKYWQVLAGCIALGVGGGYFYAKSQISIYQARSTVVVSAKSTNASAGDLQPDGISDDMMKTLEALLQTRDLAERVVKSEHLNENFDFLPASIKHPVSEDEATGMLVGDVAIRIRPLNPRLIDITVNHHSPNMAQFLANRLAQESISQELEQHNKGETVFSDHLQKEVDRLQQVLGAAERKLQDYQKAHGLGTSIDNPVDVDAERFRELNQRYMDAHALVTELRLRYGEEYPKLIDAEAAEEELRNEVTKAQAEVGGSADQDGDYTVLKSDVESDRAKLGAMLKQLNDAIAAAQLDIPGIALFEEATMPWAPISPNKPKCLGMGGLVGLICGLSFIVGVYFLDSSIRTVAQAESALGLPVIAAVPILTPSEGRSVLPTYSDPQSFVAESFRGLRASLILHDRENPLRTILVASAIPGEGKSFCGANLAMAFAQAGLNTLLIDADLRLPTLHTYFGLPTNEQSNGFTEILAGRATLESSVVASPVPTLTLLLTTTPADAPAELLSGIRLPFLLDEAAKKYDRVVIDSAPLNAVSDTMLLMQKADAILLVVRAAQTPISECKAALHKISTGKIKPLGIILNYLAPHTLKSYSYGYSYGQKPKDKAAR